MKKFRSPLSNRAAHSLSLSLVVLVVLSGSVARALDRPDITFKIFQFPADKIPRIDGNTDDWAVVPDDYAIRTDQLVDDSHKHAAPDPKNLDVKVRFGWVKGLNRLYVLYEAYDNYWDFARPDLHNDTFELVVDGDASGGMLIDHGHREAWKPEFVGPAMAQPRRNRTRSTNTRSPAISSSCSKSKGRRGSRAARKSGMFN